MDAFMMIRQSGLLPFLDIKGAEKAVPMAEAAVRGGADALEISLDAEDSLNAVKSAASKLPTAAVGAGSVRTCEQADAAMAAGASFLVLSGYDPGLAEHCLARGIPFIPRCGSADEAMRAYAQGCRMLKIPYPGLFADVSGLKRLSVQMPEAEFVIGSGTADEAAPYMSESCVAACGVGRAADSDDTGNGDFGRFEERCRQALDISLGFELAHVGINNNSRDRALEGAGLLADLFRLPVKTGDSSTYAGKAVEFMHAAVYGDAGHLGFFTNSAFRALAYFKKRGIGIIEESIRRDENGRIWFFYLRPELFGFALHVVNRQR